ncbi:vascular endothelial growth factor Ab isoform X4 [Esox lucius]|uniref:vascular endothelial growth factor Ab isoform X4 n=1 Tax=Esox lucius TaxID=8010 RepID=UPI0005765BC5|nr:vascular endothelial growth factor Ab isoform X4 [Esox lucius]
MNFVDSFVTLFLLTLLYLSAVKSAHIPKEGGSAHEGVISFMEVYNKSICRPRELLVDIIKEYPAEVEHLYIPSCVVLMRCAGCCNDESQECMPTSTHNITMEIKRYNPKKIQSNIFMSFTEHSACDCSLKKEAKEQRQNQCLPCCDGCSERRRRLFIQDPLTCQCSCRHSDADCRTRHLELNERTCKCDQPRR